MTPPGKASMLIGPVREYSYVEIFDCTEFYVTVGKSGPEGFSRSIPLGNIDISRDDARNCLELQVRY